MRSLILTLALTWPAHNTYPPAVRDQIDLFDAGFNARRAGLPKTDPREDWQTGWSWAAGRLPRGTEKSTAYRRRVAKAKGGKG